MIGEWTEAELAALYERMAPRVRLYGLRHLRDWAAAEDLAQQVLFTTMEALRAGRVREEEKLESFILGTSRMMVMGMRKEAARRGRLLAMYGGEPGGTEAVLKLDYGRLRECVQGLREKERTVVAMTYYDERTGADLAGLLGISEANVRVIRHRAMEKLRACMGVA